jgi:hypothetical protein
VTTKPKDKLRVMKDMDLREISLVDRPMQEPARVAILKREDSDDVQKRIAVTSMTAGHAHSVLTANYQGGENRIGQTSYVEGHVHDWIMDEAGNIFIADAAGHSHGIAVLTKNQPGAPAAGEETNPAGTTKAAPSGAENTSMTPEQMAALQKAAEDGKAQIAELTAAVARAQATLALDPEQRAHFDTLKAAEQDQFLALTAEQRAGVVKNLRDANPVVFKSVDGTEYRKSDDARLIKMARENDARAVELAREQSIRKQADLEKRAGEEFKTLGGDVVVKAALLGAVEGIADAGVRGKVLEALKAHDAGLGAAFTRVGTSTPAANVNKRAGERLDELAASYASTNKCDLGKAYEAVIRTDEGRALYQEHRAGK